MYKLFFSIMLGIFIVGLIFIIAVVFNLCLLVLFDFDLVQAIRNMIKKLKKIRIEKKKQKEIKRKVKKLMKENNIINFDILKFEYDVVYNTILEEIKLQNLEDIFVSELYLLKLHVYFNEICKIKPTKRESIEFLACLRKAMVEEPIFVKADEVMYANENIKLKNLKFSIKVTDRLLKNGFNNFDGRVVTNDNIVEFLDLCDSYYFFNNDKIWEYAKIFLGRVKFIE